MQNKYTNSVVIILVLLISAYSSEEKVSELHSEEKNDDFEKFYVSIGTIEKLNYQLFSTVRSWRSLFIFEEKHQVQGLQFLPQNANVLLSRFPTGAGSNVIENSLGKLCQKYFLKKPKLLILNSKQHQIEKLQSNFWNDTLCQPSVIMITNTPSSSEIESYMKQIGYKALEEKQGMIVFTKTSQPQSLQDVGIQLAKQFPLKLIKEAIQKQGILSRSKSTLVRYMSNNLLLIDDLEDKISSQFGDVNLLIPNFKLSTDKIAVWMKSYQIQLKIIRQMPFYKINLKFSAHTIHLYILAQELSPHGLNVAEREGQKQLKIIDGKIKEFIIICPKSKKEDSFLTNSHPSEPSSQAKSIKSDGKYSLINSSSEESTTDMLTYIIVILLVVCSALLCFVSGRNPKNAKALENNDQLKVIDKQYQQVISYDQESEQIK